MCREKTIYISEDDVEFDVKEDCLSRNEYINIKYLISELESRLKSLQSNCNHNSVVVKKDERYNDDEGYSITYKVQCQACMLKWEDSRFDFNPDNFKKVVYK